MVERRSSPKRSLTSSQFGLDDFHAALDTVEDVLQIGNERPSVHRTLRASLSRSSPVSFWRRMSRMARA